MFFKEMVKLNRALAGTALLVGVPFCNQSWGSLPVRVHTWVVGLIPSWGAYGKQPMNVNVFFSLSLLLSLKAMKKMSRGEEKIFFKSSILVSSSGEIKK